MNITLKLFATFREHMHEHANGACDVTLAQGAAVQDVLSQFRIPVDTPKIILVNGVQKQAAELLQEGDILSVFPPIAGG